MKRSDLERPVLVACCALFVLALQFTYVNMDAPSLGFMGLRFKDLSPFWSWVGFLMAVLPSVWMPVRLQRPSQVAYWILYLTVIVPVMWIPFHTLDHPPADFVVFSGTMLLCFFLLGLAFRVPRWHVPRPEIGSNTYYALIVLLVVAMSLAVWSTIGFRFDLGVRSMYIRRRAARESIPMGSMLSYVKGNLASAVQPYVFAVGLATKSYLLVGLSILAGVVGFSVDGSKTSAMIPLFLLLLYPLITKYRRSFGLIVTCLASFAVLLAYFSWKTTHNPWIPVVSTWRMFDVKGLLSGYYWEYFTANPKTLLGDGFLRAFSDYPYPYAASEQIGYVYFGSAQTNSNANFWTSAYGDFGYLGMFIVTGILAMVFRLIDSLSTNRGFLIPAFLCSFLGMKLSDVALDTSILSHGTLMIILLLYILPPLGKEKPKEPTTSSLQGVPA